MLFMDGSKSILCPTCGGHTFSSPGLGEVCPRHTPPHPPELGKKAVRHRCRRKNWRKRKPAASSRVLLRAAPTSEEIYLPVEETVGISINSVHVSSSLE